MNVDGATPGGISRRLLTIMAIASGTVIANLYYNQPLLAMMGRTFEASPSAMGIVAMLTQMGFAAGLLLFVPLGDTLDRCRLILATLVMAAVSLVAFGVATSYVWLAFASFTLGAFSVSPQMLVPFAAHLASPERRGRAVGTVMSGLLFGILLSRTVSGYVATIWGWRAMYFIAAGLMVLLAIVLGRELPHSQSRPRVPYRRLIASLGELIRSEPVLRESTLSGAVLMGAFSTFWATLAFRLETPPLHYGSRAAGLFGLIGAIGAAAAVVAGRLADRTNPRVNLRVAVLVTACAFVLFFAFGDTLTGLVAGVTLLDIGVQGGHITNQSRIYSLRPEARNRVNTIYMVSFFFGGAAGSALAASAWQRWQWPGVCAVGLSMLAILGIQLARHPAGHSL